MNARLTIRTFLADFLGRPDVGRCPPWPPDLFAVAAALLGRAGVYHRAVCWGSDGAPLLSEVWRSRVDGLAGRWRRALEGADAGPAEHFLETLPEPPAGVSVWWRSLVRHGELTVQGEAWPDVLCRAVFGLMACADEASVGIGIDHELGDADPFLRRAAQILAQNALLSVACEVPVDRARILPKQHTPQRGLTLRSYSHHLALCPAADVDAHWHGRPTTSRGSSDTMQLLLLPWPITMSRNAFTARHTESRRACHPERFSYFTYDATAHGDPTSFEPWLEEAVRRAEREVGTVDMLVFPELSLGPEERRIAEATADRLGAVLVAGLHATADDGMAANECLIDWTARVPRRMTAAANLARPRLAVVQPKHHRWCLDRAQVVQYGLGGRLNPRVDHWEYTRLGHRQVHFLTIEDWLTTTVLLCEDLARQDPVTHTLRAVGPNLVIALLMDGPQIETRWPARYASVLAEDPGSSVLTLTSLGMSRLSRPRPGEVDRGTVVARWRDIRTGEHELDLGSATAGVLTLVREATEEFSADGRGDGGVSTFPTFGGFVRL